MGGRVAAAAVKGRINVIPWEACMHACGEPGACRVVRSAFTRRWRAGGYWRLAVMAVVVVHQSVGLGTRCCRSACPCVQTHGLPTRDSPHGLPTRDTASACVLICGVRDAHGVGARSSEREMTAETRPGALTHGSRVY
jgi:hypothetical protein